MPILINGSEMLPAVSPSWPLVTKDEVVTEAPALLRTANRDDITFDGNTRARIVNAGRGFDYIFVRQGGLQFDAAQGPVFVCIGGRLYVPNRSAKGVLRLDPSNGVATSLEKGTFAEQGGRTCGPEFSAGFLSVLPNAANGPPGAAGGGIGGGVSTRSTVGIATTAGAIAAAGAGAFGLFNSSAPNACTSSSGCNFNPPPISSSSP